MNLLLSCIGRRGYIAEWFREHLAPGDRIIGTSNTIWTPGFAACDETVVMPSVSSEEYIPTLLEVCRDREVGGLLSFFDLDVDAIARNRARFEEIGVVPVVADARVSRIGLDKLETVRFLRENGFATAATFSDLESARQALLEETIAYPLFVKPRMGFASQNLFVAHNDQELEVFFRYASGMIIQESLRGTEHSLDILNDLTGQVVTVVVKQKLLMRSGETDQAQTIHHPAALEMGVRLGSALAHVGPLDVDLFVDGDNLAILELNPRFGGGYPAAHLAGADFPAKILRLVGGERLVADHRYTAGVRMMKDYRILSLPDEAGVDREPRASASEAV